MNQRTAWALGFSDAYHQSRGSDPAPIAPSVAISYRRGQMAGQRVRAETAAYADLRRAAEARARLAAAD